jgi:hypothetical protein
MWYNFVRPHGTLSKNEDNSQGITPAMAAGLALRPWAVTDIIDGCFIN